jgi:hypothetical protein
MPHKQTKSILPTLMSFHDALAVKVEIASDVAHPAYTIQVAVTRTAAMPWQWGVAVLHFDISLR